MCSFFGFSSFLLFSIIFFVSCQNDKSKSSRDISSICSVFLVNFLFSFLAIFFKLLFVKNV